MRTGIYASSRVSGPPPPTSPVAGYWGWWKSDALVGTSGSNVTFWGDSSGQGRTMDPRSGTTTIASGGLNGHPKIQFSNSSMVANTLSDDNNHYVIFFVGTVPFGRGLDGSGSGWSIISYPGISFVVFTANGAAQYGAEVPSGAPALHVSTTRIQNSAPDSILTYYANGVSGTPVTQANYILRSSGVSFTIGEIGQTGTFSNGDAYELIVYDYLMSSVDQALVEAYLYNKYFN